MTVANSLAYYDTETITAVKSFIVLATGQVIEPRTSWSKELSGQCLFKLILPLFYG